MDRIDLIFVGVILILFGFIGFIAPVGEFGSVITTDSLCSSFLGAVGQAGSSEIASACLGAKLGTLLVYISLGLGPFLIYYGYRTPKPSIFLCAECNIAFSTEADLYNHNVAKKHPPPKVMEEEEDEFYEEEEKKTRVRVSSKERLKNSPGLQGVLIGLVAVVVLLGIISLSTPQDIFYMSNNALSPDVNQGDLLHYQKTPLMEIKKNDIIAFVNPDEEFAAKIGKVREVWKDGDSFFFKTSNNASPSNYSAITSENFIGKITSIESAGSWETQYAIPLSLSKNPGMALFMIIAIFVAPIIILKVRKRLQN